MGVDANVGVGNAGANTSQSSGQASGSTSGEVKHGNRADKKTGLDRADEVAGEHGKQGRDNARAKQGR